MWLNRYIASCGITSRRKADQLIREGKISVNGEIVTKAGTKVNPMKDRILLKGVPLSREKRILILLNKPKGYLTTLRRQGNRPIILDLLIGIKERVYPVGRLDLDTEGLLLLSNDGDLSYRLTHPKYQVERVYEVWVDGRVDLESLRKGVMLEDGLARVRRAKERKRKGSLTLLEITLTEGRKREVKRIFQKLKSPVVSLKRVKFGTLILGDLPIGKYRFLSPHEIGELEHLLGR